MKTLDAAGLAASLGADSLRLSVAGLSANIAVLEGTQDCIGVTGLRSGESVTSKVAHMLEHARRKLIEFRAALAHIESRQTIAATTHDRLPEGMPFGQCKTQAQSIERSRYLYAREERLRRAIKHAEVNAQPTSELRTDLEAVRAELALASSEPNRWTAHDAAAPRTWANVLAEFSEGPAAGPIEQRMRADDRGPMQGLIDGVSQ